MNASTEAIALRFPKGATPAQLNAHRMTRLEAIPRGSKIHILEGDLEKPMVSSLNEFTRLTKGRLIMHDCFGPLLGEHWIGGDRLRRQIEGTERLENGITFHDFGAAALLPLEKENLTHFPCLAVGGDIIAMSLPDPAMPITTSTFQAGHKPDSWGKILPGWHLEDGRVFPGNLPLPEGAEIDGETFLVRRQ